MKSQELFGVSTGDAEAYYIFRFVVRRPKRSKPTINAPNNFESRPARGFDHASVGKTVIVAKTQIPKPTQAALVT